MPKKRIHFLGIGGSGASAAATIAQAQGFKVTGCDLHPLNEFTKGFQTNQLKTGHSPQHLACNPRGCNVDFLAVTPAILSLDAGNPELLAAQEKNIPILTWQQFTGKYLIKNKFVIAICGTHGKTTTTAMIGQLLEDGGLDPTVLLGAIIPKWGTNYRLSGQKYHDRNYFVFEADEFNDNFLSVHPDITVVTNIEMDHPEFFKDFESYKESFKKLFLQTKSAIVANLQDKAVAEILKDIMKQTPLTCFDYSNNRSKLKLKIAGKHNMLNAMAAFKVGLLLNIDPKKIQQSLEYYKGVSRRFEYLGKFKGADVYTDFGHHPTEIKVTIEAAIKKFPNKKIWLIFEPHMFSRTKYLFDKFVKVFKNLPVDKTVIIDIYPSREKDTGLVKSEQLVKSINTPNVSYNNPEELKETLFRKIKPQDIIFFMGAGDIDKFARNLVRSSLG